MRLFRKSCLTFTIATLINVPHLCAETAGRKGQTPAVSPSRSGKVPIPKTIAFTYISPNGKFALFEDLNHGGAAVIETATGKILKRFSTDFSCNAWIDSPWTPKSDQLLLINRAKPKDEILFYTLKNKAENVRPLPGRFFGARLLISPNGSRWAIGTITKMDVQGKQSIAVFDRGNKYPKSILVSGWSSEISWIDNKRLLVSEQMEVNAGEPKIFVLNCDTGQRTPLNFTFTGFGYKRDITPYPDTKGGFTILSHGEKTDSICYLNSNFSAIKTIKVLPEPAKGFSW